MSIRGILLVATLLGTLGVVAAQEPARRAVLPGHFADPSWNRPPVILRDDRLSTSIPSEILDDRPTFEPRKNSAAGNDAWNALLGWPFNGEAPNPDFQYSDDFQWVAEEPADLIDLNDRDTLAFLMIVGSLAVSSLCLAYALRDSRGGR